MILTDVSIARLNRGLKYRAEKIDRRYELLNLLDMDIIKFNREEWFIGKIINKDNCEKFIFQWIGTDELEPVYGTCCMEIINENLLLGRFVFDNGEESDFKARKQLGEPINNFKNWI